MVSAEIKTAERSRFTVEKGGETIHRKYGYKVKTELVLNLQLVNNISKNNSKPENILTDFTQGKCWFDKFKLLWIGFL